MELWRNGVLGRTTVGIERIGRITELSGSNNVLELPEWSILLGIW